VTRLEKRIFDEINRVLHKILCCLQQNTTLNAAKRSANSCKTQC